MDARSKYSSVLVAYYAGVATDLPVISPYALALKRLPRSTAVTESALSRAYDTDPFLCTKLCGVANGIFFNHDHQPLFSVRDALHRVGVPYARSLLVEAPPLSDTIDSEIVAAYWAHCMAVAHGARRVADLRPDALCPPEVAYLAGLVHDIGYLLQLHYSPERSSDITRALQTSESSHASNAHADHGEQLARYWSVPQTVVAAIYGHHAFHSDEDKPINGLAKIVAASETLLVATLRDSVATASEVGLSALDCVSIQQDLARVYADCLRMLQGEADTVEPRRVTSLRRVK